MVTFFLTPQKRERESRRWKLVALLRMASSSLFLQFLVLLFLPLLLISPSYAQSHRNVSLGSSLTPFGRNTSWLSPSGEFAFGFHPLEADHNLFLLAIWFEKIAEKTVVWYANGGQPMQNGSMAELTADGKLLLKDHNGQEVWNAGINNASYAAMLDTGNFVLVSTDASVAWQSFHNPTDTILPSQVLNLGTELRAHLTATDYSSGRFMLRIQDDGNLVLYTVAVPSGNQYDPYWSSDTVGNGSKLVFNESGRIYLAEKNGSIFNFTFGRIDLMKDFYQRATLGFDGVFRQYVYPRNGMGKGSWNENWTLMDSQPEDICQAITAKIGSGACGYNSYCTIDERQQVDCKCPPGYSFFDPSRKYEGCKPDFAAQSCDADGKEIEALYELQEIIALDWPLSDYEQLYPIEEDQCRMECLSDCFCVAATYNDRNCSKMKAPLSNGKKGNMSTKSLMKVPGRNTTQSQPSIPTGERKDKKSRSRIRSLLLGSSVLINILLIAGILLLAFHSCEKRIRSVQPNSSETGVGLRSLTYRELQEATNNFSEQLDYGGFGAAYKGNLRDEASTCVAVKRIGNLLPDAEVEFINLVKAIGQASHKNLVRLLGFCSEGTERFLVYEFLSTGPLKSFLFRSIRLKWNQRVQVVLGIARGLLYLHEECGTRIIHCDIHPGNVLLDDNFVAKLSNFESGKILGADQARANMAVRGTVGYIAPEWFKNIGITAKADVYSFGVTLLEIICCRKILEPVVENDEAVRLTDWVHSCYRNGRLDMVVGDDEEVLFDMRRAERFVAVTLWCVQEEPSLRPTMWKVTQMLDGAATVPVPPDPSSYISSIQ